MPRLVRDARERFDEQWIPEPNTGCWLWMRNLYAGYGAFSLNLKPRPAHVASWLLRRGEIPAGMVIDHMCRVRSCVNPDHLRLVTRRVNCTENSVSPAALNRLKTHCPRGHAYDRVIPVRSKTLGRRCLQCDRAFKRAGYRRKVAAGWVCPTRAEMRARRAARAAQ